MLEKEGKFCDGLCLPLQFPPEIHFEFPTKHGSLAAGHRPKHPLTVPHHCGWRLHWLLTRIGRHRGYQLGKSTCDSNFLQAGSVFLGLARYALHEGALQEIIYLDFCLSCPITCSLTLRLFSIAITACLISVHLSTH